MLGTGLIGDFYTHTLHGQRGRDRVRVVYSRSAERGDAFRQRWDIPEATTDLRAAIEHPDTDVVVVGIPNHLHEEAVSLVARAGKAVLCTKPLGRNAEEAQRMLAAVESAGVFAGYLEDLCYTPKTLKAIRSVQDGAIGAVTWVRSRETHPGPHSAWFWDGRLTGWRCDHRPRLPLHRDHPELRRQGEPAGRGARRDRHARPPDRRRGQRDRAHPVRVGCGRPVRGQLDVPRRDGPPRRGRRHPRHDLAEPLPADRVRDVHRRRLRWLCRREGRDVCRLAVPGRRRGVGARLHRHVQRHVRGAGHRAGAAGDVLRRVCRQRDHGRGVPLGAVEGVGTGAAVRVARRLDGADRGEPGAPSRATSRSSARSCPTDGTSRSSRTPRPATTWTASSPCS